MVAGGRGGVGGGGDGGEALEANGFIVEKREVDDGVDGVVVVIARIDEETEGEMELGWGWCRDAGQGLAKGAVLLVLLLVDEEGRKEKVEMKEEEKRVCMYMCKGQKNYKCAMHLFYNLMRPALAYKNTDADVKSASVRK